ncbi:Transcription factor pcc1 [Entamoeba marina]
MAYELSSDFSFPSNSTALTVMKVISADEEFKKEISSTKYVSDDLKLIRNGYNTLSENIILSLQTIEAFGENTTN